MHKASLGKRKIQKKIMPIKQSQGRYAKENYQRSHVKFVGVSEFMHITKITPNHSLFHGCVQFTTEQDMMPLFVKCPAYDPPRKPRSSGTQTPRRFA